MDDKKWLKESLDKLDGKVDRLDQRLDVISDRHIANTTILEEHMRRTEANEENIKLLREEFKPIEKHVHMIHGVLKFFGLLGVFTSILAGLVKIFSFFLHR